MEGQNSLLAFVNAVGQNVPSFGDLRDGKLLQNVLHGIDATRFETAGTHDVPLADVYARLKMYYTEVLGVDTPLLSDVDVAAIQAGTDARQGYPNVSPGKGEGGRSEAAVD